LSDLYLDILIPITLKINIEYEINQKSPSRIFRLLIGSIITDDNVWETSNAEKILNEYSDLTSACFGKKIKNLKVI
jgi:hypothetical protein